MQCLEIIHVSSNGGGIGLALVLQKAIGSLTRTPIPNSRTVDLLSILPFDLFFRHLRRYVETRCIAYTPRCPDQENALFDAPNKSNSHFIV